MMISSVSCVFPISILDSGVIQKIRDHTNENGVVELEYYIHYDDCIICSFAISS